MFHYFFQWNKSSPLSLSFHLEFQKQFCRFQWKLSFTFIESCFNRIDKNQSNKNFKIKKSDKPCGLEWQELVCLRRSRLPDCPRNWQWSHTFLHKRLVIVFVIVHLIWLSQLQWWHKLDWSENEGGLEMRKGRKTWNEEKEKGP